MLTVRQVLVAVAACLLVVAFGAGMLVGSRTCVQEVVVYEDRSKIEDYRRAMLLMAGLPEYTLWMQLGITDTATARVAYTLVNTNNGDGQ
jgi:hypothetical protein